MRTLLWSAMLLWGLPALALAQLGGANVPGASSGGAIGGGGMPRGVGIGGSALGGAGAAGGGFGGANSPNAAAENAGAGAGNAGTGGIGSQNAAGPTATSRLRGGLGVGNGSLGSNTGLANNPAASQQAPMGNQAFGQRSGQTFPGSGAAFGVMPGTLGGPGLAGGYVGARQPATVTPHWGPNNPPSAQLYQGNDVAMPSYGSNARYGAEAVGGNRVPAAAGQQYMNSAGTAAGVHQQATAQGQQLEPWRFQRHDDLWWYYTPQRTWAVFQANQWVHYERSALYARDNLANAQLPQAAGARQRSTVGRPNYSGPGINGTSSERQQDAP